MAANTNPIYSKAPDVQWLSGPAANASTPGVTANTTKDLTAGTINLVFTSDATNGGRVDKISYKPLGTNVATTARLFINNGSATGTAANNTMIREDALVATTLAENTKSLPEFTVSIDIVLPAGYKLYVTFGTATAAGFHVTALGGKY